ncbi:Regulator of Vps4 activity in the MVB pathway protein [Forsythia ovata]|uniref:Regulator of Vps4 activity in the MVB pathway protein n=1 Tax=Forsythia ovata TaxID=205694 RepID=A0ABD1VIS4_9LAMI
MANKASSSSLPSINEDTASADEVPLYGSDSGCVEARTHCDHLASLSQDLNHIPTPDTPCNRCEHPDENWLCLCCKDVLCSRFVNKHMLEHNQQSNHCLALSYSDLSVWCFSCDAYLDAQVILPLRPAYETAYILKFGEAPPLRSIEYLQIGDGKQR